MTSICDNPYDAVQQTIVGAHHDGAVSALEELAVEQDGHAAPHFNPGNSVRIAKL